MNSIKNIKILIILFIIVLTALNSCAKKEQSTKEKSIQNKENTMKEVNYTSSAPSKLSEEELSKISTDLYREGMIYYGDTHAHPNSTFAYTASSLLDLMSFDATNNVELINQPLLMIVGDKADTKYMSERVFERASGTKNKELYQLKNATHIQTYFREDLVDEAVKKLEEFYKNNL